jgi:hypothetical protein
MAGTLAPLTSMGACCGRNPFVDAHLKPYRVAEPKIIYIGAPHPRMIEGKKGSFVAVTFESTQCGLMDLKSGQFTFYGQD